MADSLVVNSKLKEAVKGLDLRMDSSLGEAVNAKINAMLKDAAERAKATTAAPCARTTSDPPPPLGGTHLPEGAAPAAPSGVARRRCRAVAPLSYPRLMPEGDTIHRAAAALRTALVGRTLTRVDVPRLPPPWPAVGAEVTGIEARGKHLLIATSDGLVVHTHQMMTGSWHLYAPGERWRKSPRAARVVLAVPGTVAVCFASPVVEVLDAAGLARHRALRRLGPDLCDPGADLDEAVTRLGRLSAPDRSIGEALLDQRIACGVGNVYRCDVLFLHGLHPTTPDRSCVERRAPRAAADRWRAAASEPRSGGGPDHGRGWSPRQPVGLRPGRAPLPAVRHRDPLGAPRGPGPARLLVSDVPAGTRSSVHHGGGDRPRRRHRHRGRLTTLGTVTTSPAPPPARDDEPIVPAPQMAAWRAFLTAHARLTDELARELRDRVGLPLTWYDVLVQLSEADDRRLRMQDLAGRVVLSKSGLTRLIDRMEREGLVSRSPCDGRPSGHLGPDDRPRVRRHPTLGADPPRRGARALRRRAR